eukprot:TRINITY_DN11548_c0_g1_i1.p1 TRINITY_DN11548_c0_g1~~TRINITY_DN11548_c0_g1_i1.p1  ORF type:complete len:302 (-),score=66.49 TRINITY_DN11548_c0_g1_i1:42-947(-)
MNKLLSVIITLIVLTTAQDTQEEVVTCSTDDFIDMAFSCSSASLAYSTCLGDNVYYSSGNYSSEEYWSYLSDTCDCLDPLLYCYSHSGICDDYGEYLTSIFNLYCDGCYDADTSPDSGFTCWNSLYWYYEGDYYVEDSFSSYANVFIDGDFSISASAEIEVSSASGVITVEGSVTLNGKLVVSFSSQIDLDRLSFWVSTSSKRDSGKTKYVKIIDSSDTSGDFEEHEVKFELLPCATYGDTEVVKDSEGVYLLIHNYDDSKCPEDYDGYEEFLAEETVEKTEDSSLMLSAMFIITLVALFI